MPLGSLRLEIRMLLSHRSVQVLSALGRWPVLKVAVGWVSRAGLPPAGALVSACAQHLCPHSWGIFSARVPTSGSPRFPDFARNACLAGEIRVSYPLCANSEQLHFFRSEVMRLG